MRGLRSKAIRPSPFDSEDAVSTLVTNGILVKEGSPKNRRKRSMHEPAKKERKADHEQEDKQMMLDTKIDRK